MKLHRLLFIFFVSATLLTACTVERRLYRPGYHVEWKSHNADHRAETPVSRNTAVVPQEDVLAVQEKPAAVQENRLVNADSTVVAEVRSSEALHVPAIAEQTTSAKPTLKRPAIRLEKRVPQFLQLKKDNRPQVSVQQGKTKAIGGLILAPLRIIFTLLLIALVAAGLILLFVLESSLGGTVLLAAGAVLLILIIL